MTNPCELHQLTLAVTKLESEIRLYRISKLTLGEGILLIWVAAIMSVISALFVIGVT